MASVRALTSGQGWLQLIMESLDYTNASCFGMALMGMQAMLSQDVRTFNSRLILLHDFWAQSARTSRVELETKLHKPYASFTVAENAELEKHIKINLALNFQTLERADQVDIHSFFNGLRLSQDMFDYPHLVEEKKLNVQDATQSSVVTASSILEMQGGVKRIDFFPGIYTPIELSTYLKTLLASVQADKAAADKPFSLVLRSANHAITIGYDQKKSEWYFLNFNHLPIQTFTTPEKLAEQIRLAFHFDPSVQLTEKMYSAFTTEIYVTGENLVAFQPAITKWQSQSFWRDTHLVTPERAAKIDSEGCSLLYLAAKTGDLTRANQLIENKADVNQTLSRDKTSPLLIAISNFHTPVALALLRAGANPNLADSKGSPLEAAMLDRNTLLITALLQAKANPYQPFVSGEPAGRTAFFHAIASKNEGTIRAFLEAGASLNAISHDGMSYYAYAKSLNNEDIDDFLFDIKLTGIRAQLAELKAGSKPYQDSAINKLLQEVEFRLYSEHIKEAEAIIATFKKMSTDFEKLMVVATQFESKSPATVKLLAQLKKMITDSYHAFGNIEGEQIEEPPLKKMESIIALFIQGLVLLKEEFPLSPKSGVGYLFSLPQRQESRIHEVLDEYIENNLALRSNTNQHKLRLTEIKSPHAEPSSSPKKAA